MEEGKPPLPKKKKEDYTEKNRSNSGKAGIWKSTPHWEKGKRKESLSYILSLFSVTVDFPLADMTTWQSKSRRIQEDSKTGETQTTVSLAVHGDTREL